MGFVLLLVLRNRRQWSLAAILRSGYVKNYFLVGVGEFDLCWVVCRFVGLGLGHKKALLHFWKQGGDR